MVTIVIGYPWSIMYIQAEKIQHDGSARGLRDGIEAFLIAWVIFWVEWRGDCPIWGGEVTTTFVKSDCHSLIDI